MTTLGELATLVSGEPVGDARLEIAGVSEIQHGRAGTITFLSNPKYRQYLSDCPAAAIITNQRDLLAGRPGIIVENPQLAIARVLELFQPLLEQPVGIHPTALIAPTTRIGAGVAVGPYTVIESGAEIGDGTIIGAHTFIGQNSRIGQNARIYPRVTIYHHCQLGDRVIIHSGTVLGSDGFGFVTVADQHHKIPQTGQVLVGSDVEIGANCAIDRATIGATVIGDGCKLDNLVHIAHNVKIGKGCLLAGEVGIAGSTVIGDFCIFAGQVGVAPHLTVGDRAVCAAKTGVTKSIPGGKIYAGMPVREIREQNKRDAIITTVALLKKRLLKLEDKVAALSHQKDE
ncbi:MAG: UDP-3-O-(3-hydroxymyristoyl)glucosamine N-acyltransferase [Candidatus Neomarinimicrobiota bacterium]